MKYEKVPTSIEEQILKLKQQGLIVHDEDFAHDQLQNISYYRLKAYTAPFLQSEQEHPIFGNHILFEDIIDLYEFDGQLRAIVFQSIEKIEIAMRTRITHAYSHQTHDGFWFLDRALYIKHENSNRSATSSGTLGCIGHLIKEIERSNEDFIAHFYSKYTSPLCPPSWMTLEVVSMGSLSRLFTYLENSNPANKAIIKELGLHKIEVLRNWLRALACLRNVCAHHSRLWNRRFSIRLLFPNRTDRPFLTKADIAKTRDNKLFGYLSIILYLLQYAAPSSTLPDTLRNLMAHPPRLAKHKNMGFPENWQQMPLWKAE